MMRPTEGTNLSLAAAAVKKEGMRDESTKSDEPLLKSLKKITCPYTARA
jgi:hypothetical protein